MGGLIMNYHIGEYYRYPGSKKKFKLISVDSFRFRFEGGHWCTGNVFEDLIRVKIKISVREDLQIELFNYE